MHWLVLVVSGALEAVWATALAASDGFRRPRPTALFAVSLVLSMTGLAWAMTGLPTGTAYAVWVGIGAVGTVLLAGPGARNASAPLGQSCCSSSSAAWPGSRRWRDAVGRAARQRRPRSGLGVGARRVRGPLASPARARLPRRRRPQHVGLARAVRAIPIGTAYAVWTGLGAALTVTWAMTTGTEDFAVTKVVLLTGIVAAVVGLKVVGHEPRRTDGAGSGVPPEV